MDACLRLETRAMCAADPTGSSLTFCLHNVSAEPLRDFRLSWASIVRAPPTARIENGHLIDRLANYHQAAPPEGLELAPGAVWTFTIYGLTTVPLHRSDGPRSAYVTLPGGRIITVTCADIAKEGEQDGGPLKSIPAGRLDGPLALMPWPRHADIPAFAETVRPYRPTDANGEETAAALRIDALAGRLFAGARRPFRLDARACPSKVAPPELKRQAQKRRGSAELRFSETRTRSSCDRPLTFEQIEGLGDEAFRLTFTDGAAQLTYSAAAGRAYGLTALAQMFHHAATDTRFAQPRDGVIDDAPRHGWRGSHVDVSRHFWTVDELKRLIDAMAWARMNRLQWHLTDDEGWRLEIKALPELTRVGAFRGPGLLLPGQYAFCDRVYGGYYSQGEVRELIDYAVRLHIEIVPEIDVPGHSYAALAAYPHLRDPDEPLDCYRAIQGYPNNALNPAMEETYAFLETVFTETASLFPSRFIHVGADEVDHPGAIERPDRPWMNSPKAKALMVQQGYQTTQQLQAHLLRRVQSMINGLGKTMAGWNEVSHGGGVDPEGTLLFAWQTPEVIGELADEGYDVIATPGQAYYLDMVQADGWDEPGASWAGTATPEHAYTYEAVAGLSEAQVARVKGVQSGIWCEHLPDMARRDHMIFPRLYAVAEAGWTPADRKDWQRFAALSCTFPSL